MLKVSNNKIMINRGDIAVLTVTAQNEDDGTNYVFKVGDVVRLKVVENGDVESVVLQKDVEVRFESTSVDISLISEDTKIGDYINRPTKYWYEVELNPDTAPQTIIGYDDAGAKLFVLYPEGGMAND